VGVDVGVGFGAKVLQDANAITRIEKMIPSLMVFNIPSLLVRFLG